ncbi:MAG: hypothetical protein GVY13_02625 [Alphaproteobacteria bacterium]|jgi:hypothetical protein|nr:hypothetical protein [Alphaproteobacteria bacterium]
MSERNITRAKGLNGKMYAQQDDGSWQELVSQTDWDAVNALTDEEVEQQAREDGTYDADISKGRMVFYPDRPDRDDDDHAAKKPDAAE